MSDEYIDNKIEAKSADSSSGSYVPPADHIPVKEAPDWEIRDDFIDNVRSELKNNFPDIQNTSEIHILLLCRSGKRSGQAAQMLELEGYKNIINIIDGFEGDKDANNHRSVMNGWRFNNLPWEQG